MKESTRQNTLKTQKLIVALCALMAVIPATLLISGIYRKDTSAIKRGAIGSVFGGSGLCLSVVGYTLNHHRKKEKD